MRGNRAMQILSKANPKEKHDENQDGESTSEDAMQQPEADVTRQRYAWTQHLLNPVNCTYLFSSDAHANSDPVSRGSEIHATPCQGESLLCLSMTEERPHAIVRFPHAYMSAWPGIPGYNTMNICCLTATVHDCTHGFYMHTSVSAMGYLMIHSVLTLPPVTYQ